VTLKSILETARDNLGPSGPEVGDIEDADEVQAEANHGVEDFLEMFPGKSREEIEEAYAQACSHIVETDSAAEALVSDGRQDPSGGTRAQTGGNLVNLIIGVLIAGIVVMNVFIPVIQDAQSNLTGQNALIAGLLPLFAILLVLISLASPLMRRV
jgi:hypothetical protein